MQWNNQIIVFHYICKNFIIIVVVFIFVKCNDGVCNDFNSQAQLLVWMRYKNRYDEMKRRREKKMCAWVRYLYCTSTECLCATMLYSAIVEFQAKFQTYHINYKLYQQSIFVTTTTTTTPAQGNIEHARIFLQSSSLDMFIRYFHLIYFFLFK